MQARLRLISLSPLLLVAACGGGVDRADPDAPDPTPACTSIDDQVLATDITLLDAIVIDGEPVALVATSTGAAVIQGSVTTPIAIKATEGSLARDGQGVVALLRDATARTTFVAQAPDFAPVDTHLDDDLSKPHLAYAKHACTTSTGCIDIDQLTVFFQGGFASASAAHRTGATWSEEELYMSSVSWIEDVADLDGDMIACARYTSSAVLLGHHPYRGELDDLEGWAARGPGCAVATHGRDVAMVLGSTPARLARWTVPLMPSAPWPTPAATTDLPMMISAYDLATEDGTLVLAYTDQDNVLHLAIESAGTWTEQPAPALRTSRAPILVSDAEARHLVVATPTRELHYARSCR